MQTFLVRTEPGSGGCLDALNPLFETLRERETRGARIAPTPRPPVEERLALVGFPDGLARQDSGTPLLKLLCVWMAGVLAWLAFGHYSTVDLWNGLSQNR